MDVLRKHIFHVISLFMFVLLSPVSADVIQMSAGNVQEILGSNELVFVNFYADWCRFSQILAPVFEETSNKVKEEFPMAGKVAFAKVDCDAETTVAADYHITKYPTLKLFRNGQVVKKEYRGQRSSDSLAAYIREQLKDSIQVHTDLKSIDDLEQKKAHVIGFFESQDSENYKTFAKVASSLREDCLFHSALGPVSQPERTTGDHIAFRPPNTKGEDQVYMGSMTDYGALFQWAYGKCVPLVREITFENAEELTEEGLPFLILFHAPDDQEIVAKFNHEVSSQLMNEKNSMNFLIADGNKFTHPLHHLGKSPSDLPVLAIDSFRHMYLFPHDVRKDLGTPGLLKQFVADLHSGKLHREFHHGPDPTTPAPVPVQQEEKKEEAKPTDHLPHDKAEPQQVEHRRQPTSPPESQFIKLGPSRNRYTILKDEL